MKPMNNKGFTLIELLITMTILSILLCLGSIGINTLYFRQKNQCIAEQIFHTLAYARNEAIKRNKIVGVCGSQDFEHCSVNWSKGYMVFVMDFPENDSPKNILRVEKTQHSHDVHSNKQTVIKYKGDGSCLTRNTIFIANQQKIVIYDSGRARIENFV